MSIMIYHNPRCSKSRETLNLLKDKGIEPEIIRYLDISLTVQTITELLAKLDVSDVRKIMRTKEAIFSSLHLNNENLSQETLINAIVEHPILLERPIVVNGDKARIGRPPEQVLDIL